MTSALRRTPLYAAHAGLGARIVPFAGWEMPVQYQGILAEARAVRAHAGLFDVSHLGRIAVEGPSARALLNWVHTADIGPEMPVGRARYGLLCNEEGGIIDDGIAYRLGEQRFLLVANAANTPEVLAWLEHWRDQRFPRASAVDKTERTAMLALQGPGASGIMASLYTFDMTEVRPFRCMEATLQGRNVLIARTGYTGEDGVELMPLAADAAWLWDQLVQDGAVPCGLGARDILRFEAALPLHGNDISPATNPIEAGLERFVDWDKEGFCGAEALKRIRADGASRRLVGFQALARGALPRAHSSIRADGETVGEVTSGGYSPTLDRNIGLGYVPARLSSPGLRLSVDVRGRAIEVETVPLPFYSRPR